MTLNADVQPLRSRSRPSKIGKPSALLLLTLLVAGCAGDPIWLPAAHKITIQQGNLLRAEDLEGIEPGISRAEIRRRLGTPIARTPFHGDRWDYLYTRGPAGSRVDAKRVTLIFDGDAVARIDTNVATTAGELPPQRRWWEWFNRDDTEEPENRRVPGALDTLPTDSGPSAEGNGTDVPGLP